MNVSVVNVDACIEPEATRLHHPWLAALQSAYECTMYKTAVS